MEKLAGLPQCQQVDDGYLEITTPFEINPDSRNPEWTHKIGMVCFPELLSYGREEDQMVPWIACRITLEGEHTPEVTRDLLKWCVELLKGCGYTPFMDEDAMGSHWRDEKKKGYTDFTCFVNPDYPEGHWENHALE